MVQMYHSLAVHVHCHYFSLSRYSCEMHGNITIVRALAREAVRMRGVLVRKETHAKGRGVSMSVLTLCECAMCEGRPTRMIAADQGVSEERALARRMHLHHSENPSMTCMTPRTA